MIYGIPIITPSYLIVCGINVKLVMVVVERLTWAAGTQAGRVILDQCCTALYFSWGSILATH